jgi:hypothetical protein
VSEYGSTEEHEPAAVEHPQHRAARLSVSVPGLTLEWIGGVAPLQGFGAWVHPVYPEDGPIEMVHDRVYFRFRHDSAQLYVGPAASEKHSHDEPNAEMPVDPPRLYAEIHEVTGNPWAGVLLDAQLRDLIPALFDSLLPYDADERPTHRDRLYAMILAEEQRWASTGSVEDALDDHLTEGDRGVYGPVAREKAINDDVPCVESPSDEATWKEDTRQR